MANVRGLNDLPANNNNGRGNFTGDNDEIPNFLNAYMKAQQDDGSRGNPRTEKFCQTLKWIFAPGMTYRSFIFIISATDVVMFLITLIGTPLEGYPLDKDHFLGPNTSVYHLFNKNPHCI